MRGHHQKAIEAFLGRSDQSSLGIDGIQKAALGAPGTPYPRPPPAPEIQGQPLIRQDIGAQQAIEAC